MGVESGLIVDVGVKHVKKKGGCFGVIDDADVALVDELDGAQKGKTSHCVTMAAYRSVERAQSCCDPSWRRLRCERHTYRHGEKPGNHLKDERVSGGETTHLQEYMDTL